MSARKCSLNSLTEAKPIDVNVILMNLDMDEVHKERRTPEQGKDIKMIDALEEMAVIRI